MVDNQDSPQPDSNYGIQVLLKWTAKERMWKPKQQQWYLISAFIILLFIFVAIRIESWFMVIALIAFMGLWFLSGYLEPWDVEHKVTSKGLYTFSRLYHWPEISHFWMSRKDTQLLAHIDFPKEGSQNRITILVPDELELQVFDAFSQYLNYAGPEKAEYSFVSKYIYGVYIPVSSYIKDEDRLIE